MSGSIRLMAILVVTWAAAVASGCQDTCDPGTTQACVCAGGGMGAQTCSADGAEWGSCTCIGPGVDSGVPGVDSGGGGIDSGGGGMDSGTGADSGGDVDSGGKPPPVDSGRRDSGPRDSGPRDSGPRDAGEPPGPTVMCAMPARMATASLAEGAGTARAMASLVFYSGGALRSIDGVMCTVDPDRTGMRGTCFDPYRCGACRILIWREFGVLNMTGSCPMYDGFYTF